jgi:iron(III) transport system substrate-binding protein
MQKYNFIKIFITIIIVGLFITGCTNNSSNKQESKQDKIIIYSGRSEDLIGDLIGDFTKQTGIEVDVKYGDTTQLAMLILEEGSKSPADIFFAQDAGALGLLDNNNMFEKLPNNITKNVSTNFKSSNDRWIGTSARARTIVYNTEKVNVAKLPQDLMALCDPEYKGKVGWAPTNASFQSYISALIQEQGDKITREWLRCMIQNDTKSYAKNTAIVEAVGRSEILYGLANHYYLYQILGQNPDYKIENHYFDGSEMGNFVNVAGVGVLNSSQNYNSAMKFVEYLMSEKSQNYFVEKTNEYPTGLATAISKNKLKLNEIILFDISTEEISDLEYTLNLLKEEGVL